MTFAVELKRVLAAVCGLGLTAAVSACFDSDTLGPNGVFGDQISFTEDISVSEFQTMVGSGTVRLEISLGDDGLVAREVEVKAPEALAEPEEIESLVASLELTDAGSVLTVELGDLQIGFSGETNFRKSDGHEMEFEQFVAHVREALAAEVPLAVRAKRAAPDTPQGPDDATFVASELRLHNDAEEQEIEINVDNDNLVFNDAPPPDGWINVLGLSIEVRVGEGLTQLHMERDDLDHAGFEGVVNSVRLDLSEFTLADETIVRVIDETHIKFEDGDHHRLPSLAAVAEALEAGETVFSAGEGAVESADPVVVVASHVVWELEIPVEDFEGTVASVSLDGQTATLDNGIVVRIGDDTHIKHGEDSHHTFPSLAAVAEALQAGATIRTFGEGLVEGENPLTILAFHVVFKLPVEDFGGAVEAVSLDARTVTLDNGIVVRVSEDTHVKHEAGDLHRLPTLEAVVEAREAGETVLAFGDGVVEGEEPLTILALHVAFKLDIPVEGFEGAVESVDLDARTATLANGIVVRVGEDTHVKHEEGDAHRLASLEAVLAALDAGEAVIAYGEGLVEGEEPLTILAFHVVFERAMEEFEGAVETVDLQEGSFTIAGGTLIHLTDATIIKQEGDFLTLQAVADAVADGVSVIALGAGVVIGDSEPFALNASSVKFRLNP